MGFPTNSAIPQTSYNKPHRSVQENWRPTATFEQQASSNCTSSNNNENFLVSTIECKSDKLRQCGILQSKRTSYALLYTRK